MAAITLRQRIAIVTLMLAALCSGVSSTALAATEDGVYLGIVVNSDAASISLFSTVGLSLLESIDLPGAQLLIDAALCPLSDGSVIAAISDLQGSVHLFDPVNRTYLDQVDLTEPALAVSCCGDFLTVSSGAFVQLDPDQELPPILQFGLDDRPPLVVDLQQRIQVAQQDDQLPGASAMQCGLQAQQVLSASLAEQTVDRMTFNRANGQLSSTFDSLDVTDPVHLTVSPQGRCGALVSDDNQVSGLLVETLTDTTTVDVAQGLTMLDACQGDFHLFVRSAFPDRLEAYPYNRRCEIADQPDWTLMPPPPALIQTPAVGTMTCRGHLLFVSVDGGSATPDGDRIEVYQQNSGRLIQQITGNGLNGPLGIDVLIRPPTRPIPALRGATLLVLALILLIAGVIALKQTTKP
ncbi:MAG: hypothetical protein Tsb002_07630 [Wenzhouxiangellaceae bacterium]